jgi:flagellar motor switch protein FliN
MTDAAAAAVPPESAKLVEIWAESIAQVLQQITGSAFPCAVLNEVPVELPAAAETDLWVACACSGGLRGEMSLRIPTASGVRLVQIFMGEAPEASPELQASAEQKVSAEQREAAVELLRQVAGLVASALKPQWGEVQLRPETTTGSPSWPASSTFWLRAGDTPENLAWFEVHLSAALSAALRAEKTTAASSTPSDVSTAVPSGQQENENDSKVKLDLLMDVELALTLRFGSRSLPLGEILDLTQGAVIELDRQVQDPVDVLLDGRVVARGEVVVMDGNYGLRVTEVGPAAGT